MDDGYFFHHVLIAILLFVHDVILLSHFADRLQRHLMLLIVFSNNRQLLVNINKMKAMIFNASRVVASKFQFFEKGDPLEITAFYTYLGVLFFGPSFSLRVAS